MVDSFTLQLSGHSLCVIITANCPSTTAHTQSMLVTNFYQAVSRDMGISQTTQQVLRDLFRLFAFSTMDAEAREFFTSGAVANQDLDALSSTVLELMQRIRPHAVRLVDAWKIPDYVLNRYVSRSYLYFILHIHKLLTD